MFPVEYIFALLAMNTMKWSGKVLEQNGKYQRHVKVAEQNCRIVVSAHIVTATTGIRFKLTEVISIRQTQSEISISHGTSALVSAVPVAFWNTDRSRI